MTLFGAPRARRWVGPGFPPYANGMQYIVHSVDFYKASLTIGDLLHIRQREVPGRAEGGAAYRMTTPHGSVPTGMSASFELVAVSITETVFERPFAT